MNKYSTNNELTFNKGSNTGINNQQALTSDFLYMEFNKRNNTGINNQQALTSDFLFMELIPSLLEQQSWTFITKLRKTLMDYLLLIRFFGDKIAILTMRMIFYKLLAIAAGIQLLRSYLCENLR